MEVKKLSFKETVSRDNIMCYCNDIFICQINRWNIKGEEEKFNINSTILNNNNPKYYYFSLDDAKHAAQEIFKEYILQFINI